MWAKPHVVYRAYDREGRLMYVGITANWPVRLYSHRCATFWWRDITRTRLTLWPDRYSALTHERQVIREERPLRNKQGATTDERAPATA